MAARVDDREAQADALIQGVLVGEAVANAGYVILVADEMMRYLAASDAACELLGYSRQELVGLSVPDLVVESTASALYEEFMRDRGQRGVITLRCNDGRRLEVQYDARQTEVGGLPYYVSVLSPVEST
jgi:PAS domain S-box-containing protein